MTSPNDEKPRAGAGEKPAGEKSRPRRRRRKPGGRSKKESAKKEGARQEGASDARQKGATASRADAGSEPGRKGRRRRGGRKPASGAAAVLAKKSQELAPVSDTEKPLSDREIASLKVHFEFLRVHRKELRLKVNAAEDLLLNGVNPPTQRGVCQHLLGKVDRSSVLRAVERLEPAAGAKLLVGVIRFSSEIEYILLYLEKVKISSSQGDAIAALAQGLERIEFDKVSAAQMRRVLQLMSELFDANDRPRLLLGMLEGRGFREAFDKSVEEMPEALAELMLPLRAAQETILQGGPNRSPAHVLREGVYLLLAAGDRALRSHPEAVRRRLFEKGVEACRHPDPAVHRSLAVLLASFPKAGRVYRDSAMILIRHFLAEGDEAAAREILQGLAAEQPGFHLPARWLARLDLPKIDQFSVEGEGPGTRDVMNHHRSLTGFDRRTMRPVWIQLANPDHQASHKFASEVLGGSCIPGLAPLLAEGTTDEGEAYFAIPGPGPLLSESLEHKGGLELSETLAVCQRASEILAAMATAGVELPDANPARFAIDSTGWLVLIDLCGASSASAAAASSAHLALAREFCLEVLGRARRHLPPVSLEEGVASTSSFAELVRIFATSPGAS